MLLAITRFPEDNASIIVPLSRILNDFGNGIITAAAFLYNSSYSLKLKYLL